jgi:hypothetical protein
MSVMDKNAEQNRTLTIHKWDIPDPILVIFVKNRTEQETVISRLDNSKASV